MFPFVAHILSSPLKKSCATAGQASSGPQCRPVAPRFLVACCLLTLFCGRLVAQDKQGDDIEKRGLFEEKGHHIGQVFRLTFKEKSLSFDRTDWTHVKPGITKEQVLKEYIEKYKKRGLSEKSATARAQFELRRPKLTALFEQLASAIGASSIGSGSSRSGGSSSHSARFSGRGMFGRLQMSDSSVTVLFREEEGLKRSIEIRDDGQGAFRLTFANQDGDRLLLINQGKKGRLSVVDLDGDHKFSETANSFIEFYAKHREYVEQRLYPTLRRTGIGLPLSLRDESVKKGLLASITPLSKDDRLAFDLLIGGLNSGSFREREAATKKLSQQIERFKPAIDAALRSKETSPEARSRLEKVRQHHRDKYEVVDTIIDGLRLHDDAEYLVKLFEVATEQQSKALVVRLQKVTDQKLADANAWRDWLAKRKKQPPKK